MAQGAVVATCLTCPYYLPNSAQGGICRRNPPHPFVMPGPHNLAGQTQMQLRGLWPPVAAGDVCGHHPQFDVPLAEIKFERPAANGEAPSEPAAA